MLFFAAGQAFADVPARPAPNVSLGRTVYQTRCAVCHGEKGDGKGPAATGMNPPPRDFTAGQYRVRSTPPGQPATGADLYRSISNGMAGTAMVAWSGLLPEERWALVDYLQSLSPRFAGPEPRSIHVPPAPPTSGEAVTRGRDVFVRFACASCHGDQGHGDGVAAVGLKDSSGNAIKPYDMTTGHPKRGNAPEDLFLVVRAGIEGTPMPGFDGALSDEDTWDLVRYVQSLSTSPVR